MKRRRKSLLFTALLPILAALLLIADSRLRTVTYVVASNEITETVRLAVVSDLHSCNYGEGQTALLDAVASVMPDAVLLPGDIVDDKLPEEPAWITVEALAEHYPCYYVTGNHEWWSGEAERICADMELAGVTVLRGESAALDVNGEMIVLHGIDDPDSGETGQLARVGAGTAESGFHVLLAHRPESVKDYLAYPFDLIVSGHAHGGQWRLPGVINGLYAPNQGLFPEYAGGRYDFEDTVFLVSRGLARESTPLPRIFNRPELLLVELRPAEQEARNCFSEEP